jgi:hypothetical protein
MQIQALARSGQARPLDPLWRPPLHALIFKKGLANRNILW